MHLCGRIVRVARFLPEIRPPIWEHRGYAHEVQNAEQHPAMDPFSFANFYVAVRYLFERCPLRFGPKDAGLFRKIDLDFRRPYILEYFGPIASNSLNKATEPFSTRLLLFLVLADCQPQRA